MPKGNVNFNTKLYCENTVILSRRTRQENDRDTSD